MRQKLFEPEYVLDIRNVAGLKDIRQTDRGVEMGALASLTSIEQSALLRRRYPVLTEAAATVASPLLRNMGTIGGNICLDTRCLWYNQSLTWRKGCGFCIKKDGDLCHVAPGGTKCWAVFSGDTPPALLCLAAEIEIASASGSRRMPLSDFYTGEGDAYRNLRSDELLTQIFLPESSADYRGVYRKLRVRGSIDYPLAGVAVVMKKSNGHIADPRVAITAVNPAPLLVKGAGELLAGQTLDEASAEAIGDLAAKMARPLTTSALTPEYRREMIRVFTKRAVLAAAEN
jgi:4-hydroxybenzoyl-CoA reductase subunit beta